MPYDPQIAIPTLTGSVLSCVATASVLVSYIVYADQQRSFRHALVLNLALAGIYAIKHGGVLTTGPACTLNGWVGQWSVQAADFSILAIAIITLLTITRKTYMPAASLTKKMLICASVWFVPTITASTAAGLHQMKPVSGNWCWISASRTDLRYALGHGWRFAIILATVCIYLYVWWYMRRHFSQLHGGLSSSSSSKSTGGKSSSFGATEKRSRGSNFFPDGFEMGPRNESQTQLHEGEISVEYRFEVRHSDSSEAPVSAPVVADGAGHKKHDSHLVGAIPGGGEGGLPQSSGSNRSSMASVEDPYGNPVSELYSPTEIKPALFAFKTGGTAVVESLSAAAAAAAAAPPHTSHRFSLPHHSHRFSLSHHSHSHRFSLPHHNHHSHAQRAAASPPHQQPLSSPLAEKPSTTHSEEPTTPTLTTTTTTRTNTAAAAAAAAKNRASTLSRRSPHALEREVRRMLLLNAYPVLYVLLWLPGLSNRVVEAATGRPDRALAVLQCSTQFIGLANALTYGFNEHLRERVRGRFEDWWASSASSTRRGWGRRRSRESW